MVGVKVREVAVRAKPLSVAVVGERARETTTVSVGAEVKATWKVRVPGAVTGAWGGGSEGGSGGGSGGGVKGGSEAKNRQTGIDLNHPCMSCHVKSCLIMSPVMSYL